MSRTVLGGVGVLVLGLALWLLLDRTGQAPGPDEVPVDRGPEEPESSGAALVGSQREGAPPVAATTGRHTVVGTVQDADGNALAGVPVEVTFARAWPGSGSYAATIATYSGYVHDRVAELLAGDRASVEPTRLVSDAQGAWVFRTDAPGTYRFRGTPDPPRIGTTGEATLFQDALNGRVTLRVLDGVALAGRVIDSTGAPVRARVEAAWTQKGVGRWSEEADASDDGTFRFAAVPRGVVTLGVVAAKRTFARVAVVTTPTDGPVTIVVPAGAATIESLISDPQGAPVAGASVLLELEVPPATEGADAKAVVTLRLGARTDDAG
ncbi:MAG: carboxypeptidase-like regulatory domain-containing protein, partial [Planctomycetota bacterium]|nr:carboxypeptidase-like regulatory domain-containing protein [Planctomycetota bacterium]